VARVRDTPPAAWLTAARELRKHATMIEREIAELEQAR
jgi:hypothetical protein